MGLRSSVQRITQFAATAVGLTVKRHSSGATADLMQWQDETGAVLASIDGAGKLNATKSAAITAASSSSVGLTVQRFSSTLDADLQQWRDHTGAVLSFIRNTGKLAVNQGIDITQGFGVAEFAILSGNSGTPIQVWNAGGGQYIFKAYQDRFETPAVRPGALNAYNSLSDVKFAGRKTSAGIPTSSTWVANDMFIDSKGIAHLCTTGGTPGTWAAGGWQLAGFWKAGSAVATSGAVTVAAYDELMIVARIVNLSAADNVALRFNGDTGNNYRSRYLVNDATSGTTLADVATATSNMARLSGISDVTHQRAVTAVISNLSGTSKLGTVQGAFGSGSVSTQTKIDLAGHFEWVNTTAQITSVTMLTVGGTVTMAADSGFLVFGRDFA